MSASVLCHLTWFKGLKPTIPFLGTRHTSRFIGAVQLLTTCCLMVAVGLLLATVIKLKYSHNADGHRTDVPLMFDFNPDRAGWVCIGLLCLGFLVMALIWSECIITGVTGSWESRDRDKEDGAEDTNHDSAGEDQATTAGATVRRPWPERLLSSFYRLLEFLDV